MDDLVRESSDDEIRTWVMERYGAEEIAREPELARRLYEDVQTVEREGDFPLDDNIPYDGFVEALSDRLRRTGLDEGPHCQAENT